MRRERERTHCDNRGLKYKEERGKEYRTKGYRKVNMNEKKMRRAGRNTDERDQCKGITIDFLHIGWSTEGQKEQSGMKADMK